MGNKVCQPIAGLVLDSHSRKGIAYIKRIAKNANIIITFASIGQLEKVMSPKASVSSSIKKIKKTDWEAYANAMKAMPDFTRNLIRREAEKQQLSHQMDYKQVKFWEGIEDGCRP